MPVNIESTRFGALEVPDESVLEFPNGLIGLGGTRYTLIARPAASSPARLIRKPELSRSMDFARWPLVPTSWRWALNASTLVLILSDIGGAPP